MGLSWNKTVRIYADTTSWYDYGNNLVYATARSTCALGALVDTDHYIGQRRDFGTTEYRVWRTGLSFSLHTIPFGVRIVSATLNVCAKTNASGADFLVKGYRRYWRSPPGSYRESNYDAAYDSLAVLEGTLRDTASGWVDGTYYSLALDVDYIVPGRYNRYYLVSDNDVDNQAPIADEYVTIYTEETAGVAKDPYLEVVYEADERTFCACLAEDGPPNEVNIYDRDGILVVDPRRLSEHYRNLHITSVLPGGFESCSVELGAEVFEASMFALAYRMEILCGMTQLWAGRISDVRPQGTWVTVEGLGGYEHANQRRAVTEPQTGETVEDFVKRVVSGYLPLMGADFSEYYETGYSPTGLEWERETIAKMIQDTLALGDQYRRQLYWNVWQREAFPGSGSYDDRVSAGVDDAYNRADGGDNAHGTWTLRMGYGGAAGDSGIYTAGCIWRDVSIPKDARVLTAYVRFESAGSMGADLPMIVDIYAEDTISPADFTVSWPGQRTKTANSAYWQRDSWPAAGVVVQTVSIVEVIQELVNRNDWTVDAPICLLFAGRNQSGTGDTRKQAEAFEDVDVGAARLVLEWGIPEESMMALHSELIYRRPITWDNIDYVVYQEDVQGNLALTWTTKELYNCVVAQYGEDGEFTDAAEDEASQLLYDKRESDPNELTAPTQALAEDIRDTYLAQHKDPIWQLEQMTLKRLRNRNLYFVNLANVRPGSIVWLPDVPTLDPTNPRCVFVVATEYSEGEPGRGTLRLTSEALPTTLDVFIKRLEQRLE